MLMRSQLLQTFLLYKVSAGECERRVRDRRDLLSIPTLAPHFLTQELFSFLGGIKLGSYVLVMSVSVLTLLNRK